MSNYGLSQRMLWYQHCAGYNLSTDKGPPPFGVRKSL